MRKKHEGRSRMIARLKREIATIRDQLQQMEQGTKGYTQTRNRMRRKMKQIKALEAGKPIHRYWEFDIEDEEVAEIIEEKR